MVEMQGTEGLKAYVLGLLHGVYFRALWRAADHDGIRGFFADLAGANNTLDVSSLGSSGSDADAAYALEKKLRDTETALRESPEAEHVRAYKEYLLRACGYDDEATKQESETCFNVQDALIDAFVQRLNYLPRKEDYLKYVGEAATANGYIADVDADADTISSAAASTSTSTTGEFFRDAIRKDIASRDDFKYLQQCRADFAALALGDSRSASHARDGNPGKMGIKFYGPVGTSGYAKVARNMIGALQRACVDPDDDGDVNIGFVPVQFHNYMEGAAENVCCARLAAVAEAPDFAYQYVVIHSTPELWPTIAKLERERNPGVFVYGISVWETDALPWKWDVCVQSVDRMSVPSEFSAVAFRKVPGVTVDVVHHPIYLDQSETPDSIAQDAAALAHTHPVARIKQSATDDDFPYVFYNISEWTNRKGVSELICAFLAEFRHDPRARLYVKTYGDVKREEGTAFLLTVASTLGADASRVTLDYDRVDDRYIAAIHVFGDCYVSLCKSEGHGVGACYAALYHKPVVITDLGGQTDYLPRNSDIHYVAHTPEPAVFCTPWVRKHAGCKVLPHCRHFEGFVPCLQNWARPDVRDCCRKMRDLYARSVRCTSKRTCKYMQRRFGPRMFAREFFASLRASSQSARNGTARRRTVQALLERDETRDTLLAPSSRYARYIRLCDFLHARQSDDPLQCLLNCLQPTADGPADGSGDDDDQPQLPPLRVLHVSAAGYGNVGDDCYSLLMQRWSATHGCVVRSIPDNMVLLASGAAVPFNTLGAQPADHSYDAVVFGGGGLLYGREGSHAVQSRRRSLWYYAHACVTMGKPYYVMSVGFQDVEAYEDAGIVAARMTPLYGRFLAAARYVSVRSVLDHAIARAVVRGSGVTTRLDHVHYHPDVAYAARELWAPLSVGATNGKRRDGRRDVVLVAPTEWANVRRDVVVRDIREAARKEDVIVFMDWGGHRDQATAASRETHLYEDEVHAFFPRARCLRGLQATANEDVLLSGENAGRGDIDWPGLGNLLRRCKLLISGRYHGMVLGKAADVPCVRTYAYENYKFEADRLSLHPNAPGDALSGLATRQLMHVFRDAVVVCRLLLARDSAAGRAEHWSEDERNTCIARLHEKTRIDIPMLQNWSNGKLHNMSCMYAARSMACDYGSSMESLLLDVKTQMCW